MTTSKEVQPTREQLNERQRLIDSNRELIEQIWQVINQWERQKHLFPELSKDGWMELEIKNAKTAINNAKNILP